VAGFLDAAWWWMDGIDEFGAGAVKEQPLSFVQREGLFKSVPERRAC
jgi:hypothetical protein